MPGLRAQSELRAAPRLPAARTHARSGAGSPPGADPRGARARAFCACATPGSSGENSAQVSECSSSDEDGPPRGPKRRSSETVPKHSTPEEGYTSRRRHGSPPGRVPYRRGGGSEDGSPLPARSSRDLPSPVQKRRLSTIWASEESSGQPDTDPWAPEEPPVPAEVTQRQRQQKEQQGASPAARTGSVGWPGIPSSTGRQRRDLKKLAAVMERVRQWEARQLQSIEEATQHELTVQDE